MTEKQWKYSKIALTLTFPIWFVPFSVACGVYAFGTLVWELVDSFVEEVIRKTR